MDFNWREVFVPPQKEEVPFIGDVMNLEEMENFEVKTKKIELTSIGFNGQKLLAEVALTADFSDVPAGYDYVIVCARLLLSSGSIKDMPAMWSVSGGITSYNLREVPIDIEVTPGPSLLKSFWVMKIDDFYAIHSVPTQLSLRYQYFDHINMVIDQTGRFEKEYLPILAGDDKANLLKLKNFAWTANNVLKQDIIKNSIDLSSENWVHATVYIVKKLLYAKESIDKGGSFLTSIETKYSKKREIINFLSGNEIKYINNLAHFEEIKKSAFELFVIFINSNGWLSSQHILNAFLRMKSQLTAEFVAVDLDLVDSRGQKPFVIKAYKRGYCQNENVIQEIRNATKALAKCKGKPNNIAPKARGVLEIPCPGFHLGDCPNVKLKWVCFECQSTLYYGFDNHFYCFCGGAEVSQFEFRCGRVSHEVFLPFTNHSGLKLLHPIDPLNIIILGQSGVGKSTWINAFVNYMTYKSLDEARNSEFPVPIPVKFSVTEENCKQVEVVCGKYEEDENLKSGESATQNCKEYNIVFENRVINLIDTPGLGDTRGIDEDRKNVKKILEYLRLVNDIHGICIVLKPNEARITVLLKYCLKEILSNLHKSCKENLIFCFTHARQTFYRAGETLPTLKTLLREIGVNESCLDRSFHMDNEAFRFLCCQSANIQFKKAEEESFAESWDRSAQATKKLLDTVAEMVPHRTTETLSLNRSRSIILTLIPFMVEISENIERNLQHLENHEKMVSAYEGTLDDLKNKRFTTEIDIERQPLGHPRTVCAYENCVRYEFLPQSGERQAIYKTHCHERCYLSGKTPDVYPNPELKGCAAMSGSNYCTVCRCSWDIHMHIWYDQKLTEKSIKDDDIERQINDYHDTSALKADLIAADQRKVAALENEKKIVISNCVKFACFLKANAIIAYNDSFLDYFEMTLRTLENIQQKTPMDENRIKKMKETKQLYLEERKIFSNAASSGNVSVTLDDIAKSEKELYDLPMHGKQLQTIMKAAIANQTSAPRDGSNAKMIVANSKKGAVGKLIGIVGSALPTNERENSYNPRSTQTFNRNASFYYNNFSLSQDNPSNQNGKSKNKSNKMGNYQNNAQNAPNKNSHHANKTGNVSNSDKGKNAPNQANIKPHHSRNEKNAWSWIFN